MTKPASGILQKIILWLGIGTFISIISFAWFASAKVQKFDDKLDKTIETVAEYKIMTDKKLESHDRKIGKIEQCIAAHTGKPINGGGQ
jgi:hypothetical protein